MNRSLSALWRRYRGDVMAGITVAIVALPLALAFGIASGAGPAAGLYAAIFAGFATSLFGGSEVNVSGPTGAMTVVLVHIISRHGLEGMALAGLMAGAMQLLMGALRLGGFVKFLPHAVISGFTNGIALLIFLSQVEPALQSPLITGVTAVTIVLALRYARRSIPPSLYGLAAGVALNELLIRTPHVVGHIPSALPKLSLPLAQLGNVGDLIMPAITIFLLGSIEALLSAEIGDMMTGRRHDGNRELIGQGIGNVVSALVGGVPVTGAIARTAVNVKSGARTRLAGMLHAVILFIIVVAFGPWAERIPLAALAAILMVTAVRMADLEGFRLLARARWTYGATFLVTMVLTVVQDLTIAVAVGVGLAIVFAIVDLASPQVQKGPVQRERWRGPLRLPGHVQVVTLGGPLLFVAVEKLWNQLQRVPEGKVLVLDMSAVTTVDESGALMLKRLAEELRAQGRSLYVAGLRRHPLRVLVRLGLLDVLGRRRVTIGVDTALRRAVQEGDSPEEVRPVAAAPSPVASAGAGEG